MKVPSCVEKNPDCLTELSEGFRTGRLSVKNYLGRLERLFVDREPWIRAFVEEQNRFERLRREATMLESQFPELSSRPPFYGIPVGVKDIFHVEGFPTRAGSRLPPEVLRGPQAKVVSDLKSVGALVLGKTVSAEFAYFAPGPTRNPHNLDHTPGGSSSGSAAAVAAGFCPLALGTQTGGSLLRPAAFCGVVGFKPSFGRISAEGIIPLANSLDQVGFFTSDVGGAKLVASALCAGWRQLTERSRPVFGVPEGPYLEKASPEGLQHFHRTCDDLSNAGFEIVSIEMLTDIDEVVERHKRLVAAEAAIIHQGWFRDYGEVYHEKTATLISEGKSVSPEVAAACRSSRKKFRSRIVKTIRRHDVSALLAPSAVGPAPKGLDDTGDQIMNLPWTNAGLPAISLPSGLSEAGLPMGLQVIGSWMADEELLSVAEQIAEHVSL